MGERRAYRRLARVLGTLLAAMCLLGALAATAQAATSYESAGGFAEAEPEDPSGVFHKPTAIAVDDSTGDVLVVDSEHFSGAPGRVFVFDDGGAAASVIGEFGNGELSAPYGIAIDQTNGDVYVSDAGTNRIVRYTRTATTPPTYAPDPSFVSPGLGSGSGEIGSFRSPIAVDPTNGDLLVADTGNLDVARFTSSGAFVGSFNGEGSEGGPFTSLLDLTVDPAGHIYTVNGSIEFLFENVTEGRVDKFSAAGTPEGSVGAPGALSTALSVAFDPTAGNLLVALQGEIVVGEAPPSSLMVYHGEALIGKVAYPDATENGRPVGLAVDGGASGRVYGLVAAPYLSLADNSVQTFNPILVPEVEIDTPTNIQTTSAHLSGKVNPGGVPTTAHFEYSVDKGSSWISTTPQEVGAGEQAVPVSADVENLIPNSVYEVRLTASNEAHANSSPTITFTTLQAAPGVTTGTSTEVDESSASVNGQVNPFGLNSTYYFEYGPTTGYGRQAPAVPAVAGNGFSPKAVSSTLTGLDSGTTYHYRLVATNAAGTSYGADATFTTPSAGSIQERVYEQVTPVDKGLGTIAGHGFKALPSGDGLLFTTSNTMNLPGAESAPVSSRYVTLRTSSGWTLRQTDPPLNPVKTTTVLNITLAVSEDLTHALVASNRALAPGAVEGNANLYIREIATGQMTFVGGAPGEEALRFFVGPNVENVFVGGTSNFSSIVFDSVWPLTPEGAFVNAYRWTEAEGLKLLSVMPNGEPAPIGAQLPSSSGSELRYTSSDTERTIFAAEGLGVFARLGSDETIALSKSEVPGEPEEPQPGVSYWMARDGSRAVFSVSSSVPLTQDAPAAVGDLYEYSFASGALRYLGNQEVGLKAERREDVFAVSESGSYVYVAPGPSSASERNLYLFHDGSAHFIAPLPVSIESDRSVSPSGRYLAFESSDKLTEYDNEGKREVYLYDADEEALTCASCPPSGAPSTGDAHLPENRSEFGANDLPKAVTDQGTVFFDTQSRLLPGDVNGTRDVYAYHDGTARLISPGDEPFEATFIDASASGNDVFFKTAQGLVRQDADQLVDIYDARVGGGIAGQNQVTPVPCSGEACRASAPPAPAAASIGSQAVHGASQKAKKHRKRPKTCKAKGKAKPKRRCTKHKKKTHKPNSSKSATRRQGR